MDIQLKRLLSLFLAVWMVISMMPTNIVFAEDDVEPAEGESYVEETDPPATEPEETDPPATEPKETTPPVTEPKETTPPATEPEETDPPATEPKETTPPVTEPKETTPPATEPEETEPPATEPEETDPPATEPEETDPPATEPEETTPPATEPEETTPPTEPVCTGLADCAAQKHEDTCEKKIAEDKVAADAVAEMIAALPELEDIKAKPRTQQTAYYNQVMDAYGAYCALTADQQALLPPAEEVFKPYFEYFATLTEDADMIADGTCGDNLTWILDADGTLTISGTGAMNDYNSATIPWYSNLSQITSVVIESGVTRIGDEAFSGCTNLASITIPEGVTSIGKQAFYGCTELTSITIPNGVTRLNDYVFAYCSKLTSITIPNSVAAIGYAAFRNCISLETIYIPESVTAISATSYSYSPFNGCSSDLVIYCGATSKPSGWNTYWNYINSYSTSCLSAKYGCAAGDYTFWSKLDSSITELVIPDTVTSIPGSACADFVNLQKVYIPASVETISANTISTSPFNGCPSDLVIYCGAASKPSGWNSYWNYYASSSTLTVKYGWSKEDYAYWSNVDSDTTELVIPEGITSIPANLFANFTKLTSVSIPASVTSIGNSAFAGCTTLTSVTISEGLKTIGASAFYGCTGLTGITLPDSVTSIGNSVFYGCTGLTDVTLSKGLTSISNSAFYNCSSLESVAIPRGVTSIGTSAFYGCEAMKQVTIPDSVTSIGFSAFSGCSGLTRLYIPKSVTTITATGYSVSPFYGCSGSLAIYCGAASKPSGWDSNWNYYANGYTLSVKYGCTLDDFDFWSSLNPEITELVIPEGITNIPDYACRNFTSLKSVSIPESVTNIGYSAFYNCTALTEMMIPDSVTAIRYGAFMYCSSLKYVYIPASVTTLGSNPFYGCPNNILIYCEAASEPAGWDSSWDCCSSSSYYYANNQIFFGRSAAELTYWANLDKTETSIVIPDYVTTIPNDAFSDCTSLKSITIPDSVTHIGYRAFKNCTGLTSIFIPASVTTIKAGSYTSAPFSGCSLNIYCELALADTPSSWDSAWRLCADSTYLSVTRSWSRTDYNFWTTVDKTAETIVIPDGVTQVPASAFADCTELKSVTIPDSVTTIFPNAFQNCSSLTDANIPSGVTKIGSNAFQNCISLSSIYIPDSVTTISCNSSGLSPFYGCSDSLVIYCGAVSKPSGWDYCWNFAETQRALDIFNCAEEDYDYWRTLDKTGEVIAMPDGISTIPEKVFQNCTNLKYLYIPASVTSICVSSDSDAPFFGCSYDLKLCCEAKEAPSGWEEYWNLRSIGSYSQHYRLTTRYGWSRSDFNYWTTMDNTSETVVLPENITLVADGAFENCTTLTSITIPAGVTAIGEAAFRGCTGLTEIVIPDSVTSIDSSAFSGCTGLTKITIPDSVTSIGSSAFYSCSALTEITLPKGITSIDAWAFENCTGLTEITIPEGVTSIDQSAFSGCTGLTEISIPDSVTAIDYAAFSGCTGLTEITLPEGVTSIGGYAFSDCTGLTEILIPDSVTTIDYGAFSSCTGLTGITIPEGVTSIGSNTFSDCTGLREVTIPASVTSIGDSAFNGCNRLAKITIPEGVASIGERAFYNCTRLKEVTFPRSVTSIGEYAFSYCANLTDLYFGHMASDELDIPYNAFQVSNSTVTDLPVTIHVPTSRDIHAALTEPYQFYRVVTWNYTGNIPVTGIALTEANSTTVIEAGLDLNFTATLTPADCTSELVWTASNGGMVKETDYISGTATIIGTQPGIMTVRCESADDNTIFAEYQVEILPPTADAERIVVRSDTPFENEVEVGTTVQMIADVYPGNTTIKDVIWTLENGTGTAELDENGMLTALTTGNVTVRATSTDGTEVVGSATIKIVRYVDDLVLLFNGDPTKTTIGLDETFKVTFEHFPADSTANTVTWTLTDDTGSLKKGDYGDTYIYITGAATGTATITATANDSKKTSVSVELEIAGERGSYPAVGGNIYYNTVTGAIIGADSTVTSADIPAKIKGTTITSIAPLAFAHEDWDWWKENTTLSSVTIPSTVTYIGDRAFYLCSELGSLSLGSGVTTIGARAFYGCASLANLAIPESVTSVGEYAFWDLESLSTLTLPGELDSSSWLSHSNTLSKITLTGKTVCGSKDYDYYGQRGRDAKTVEIRDTVTAIESYAFYRSTNIERVIINGNLTRIDEEAFYNCDSLCEINLPDSLTHIGKNAFYGCDSLQILDLSAIPDTITQQNFPLTDDLVSVPDLFIHATDGKANFRWDTGWLGDDSGYGWVSEDNTGSAYLYIQEPGKIKLVYADAYTGIRGYKIVDCELGLEIDGLHSNSLTYGDRVTLTAVRMPGGKQVSVKWSLRSQDKAYASISATSGKSITLTAKKVTSAQQIQLTATPSNSSELPETRTIWILPKTSGITIKNKETGDVLGKTGAKVKTIPLDLRDGSITLSGVVAPVGASERVYWQSSNYNVAEVDSDGVITPKQPGTATITAYASDNSGKSASFKLKVYYLDTAATLTAKADVPVYGLEELDSAPIHVYGASKQPLDPDYLNYYIPDEQLEIATIDEETGILNALKPGTVTVTASIKDDPLSRKVSVKVKVIPALTTTIFLTTPDSEVSKVVMLDPNGAVTTDPQQAARYRVYLDKEQMLGGSFEFPVSTSAIDSTGKEMILSDADNLKWATTDKRIAVVTGQPNGCATVKVNAKVDGACVITATSTDAAKVEGVLEVFVRDYTPRLDATSLTLNSYLEAGTTVGMKPAYDSVIDEAVEVLEYVSARKTYEPTSRFTASYSGGTLTIKSTAVLSNATYKLKICTTCSADEETTMRHEQALSVKVSNKQPAVTLKQNGKFNLFDKYSVLPVTVTSKNNTIANAWIESASTKSFRDDGNFDTDSSVMNVVFTDGYIAGTAGKLDAKVNVLVKVDGYRGSVKKALTLSTVTTKPALSLTPSSGIINTTVADKQKHSTTFQVLNKTTGTYMDVTEDNVAASFADVSVDPEQQRVTLTLKEGIVISSKGASATVTLRETNWMSAIKLSYKVTVQKTLPTVKFSSSSLKLNRIFTDRTASTTVSLSQQNMAIGSLEVVAADSKAATRTQAEKVSFAITGTTITAMLDENELPKSGTYTYRVNATLSDGTKLAPKTFKVTVGSTVPTVKLKTPTLKLNKKLGMDHAIAQTAYSISNGSGYEFVRFDLPENWSNKDIDVHYRDGLVYAKLNRDSALTGKKGTHTIALTPVLRDLTTESKQEVPLPTTVKLTVQVESKTPSVTVTAKGKLDATLPDSAITYTVKSFANVPGSPTDVTLEGTHRSLFDAKLVSNSSKPVVTLTMADGAQYNPKTTYKVTLVFHISGQEVRKSVSFKVAQTTLKLKSIPTLKLYQFQSRPMTTEVKVSAPAGATIAKISMNGKTPYQFRRALGADSLAVEYLQNGNAVITFNFKHPGYLTCGKSYTVYLDVTPASTGVTNKATQIKLTVKSYK